VVIEGRDLVADRLGDRRHLRDPGVELRTELAMQEASHVLALGHAVGDALAVEFVNELFQPEVNIDRLRAKRGIARAVVFPMVAKGVPRSSQGCGRRCRSGGRCRTGVALNGREVLFTSDMEGGSAVRGHKGEFSFVHVGVEGHDENDEKDLVGRGAGVVGRRSKGAKTVQQEADNRHMSGADGEVDMIAGILHYHNIC
jgi:hypothetical protein